MRRTGPEIDLLFGSSPLLRMGGGELSGCYVHRPHLPRALQGCKPVVQLARNQMGFRIASSAAPSPCWRRRYRLRRAAGRAAGRQCRIWLVVEAEQDPAVAPSYLCEEGLRHPARTVEREDWTMSLLVKQQARSKPWWRKKGAWNTLASPPLSAIERAVHRRRQRTVPGAAQRWVTIQGERLARKTMLHSVFEDESPFALICRPAPTLESLR